MFPFGIRIDLPLWRPGCGAGPAPRAGRARMAFPLFEGGPGAPTGLASPPPGKVLQ